MSEPLVSIVTPSFNQGWSIEDMIVSIKSQTYSNIEHIIMDGESTDQTLDVIRRHESTYDLRWRSEADEGMYDAINKGFRMARGDIVAYLNSDDFYLPWTVKVAVEHLANASMIFGDLVRLDEATNTISPAFSPSFTSGFYSCFGFISQPTVFFRREVFEHIGLFDQVTFGLVADCDYWLRCALAGTQIVKVWEFLAVEREHSAMQRAAKNKQLQREIGQFRSKYSNCGVVHYNFYRLLNHLHWRFMLIAYKTGLFPNRWPKTRESRMMNLSWRDLINAWISTGSKSRCKYSADQIRWTQKGKIQ